MAVALALPALYLLLWPVPVDPGAWTPPEAPALVGVYQENTLLGAIERIADGVSAGPEDVTFDSEGRLYAGMADGRIMRFSIDGTRPELFANTGGRPLGMVFDRNGALIVADAIVGLLSISSAGAVTVLADEVDGEPIRFADDLDIATDGTIYFSDASTRFPIGDFMLDIVEHRPNGRLLAYDPSAGSTRIVLDSLYFANGVAMSPDQSFVLIVETAKYRVRRHWLVGPQRGTTDLFIDNLPGFPDNISSDGEGTFWLALAQGPPARRKLDPLLPRPFLRKILARLPASLRPLPEPFGFVLGLDLSGQVRHNLQDPSGAFAEITSATEHRGMLYFGSIAENAIGRLARP